MKIELLPYTSNFVPRACDFGDRRYSKLKRTYPAVPDDYHWTPATIFARCITAAITFWMTTGVESDAEHLVALTLTEDDIPGASLREPFESHTVTELRWWLLCRGITVPTTWKKEQVVKSVHEALQAKSPIVDVDGSYLYRKQQRLSSQCAPVVSLPLPAPPLTGWEPVSARNVSEMSKKVPPVMPGLLYTYLAAGCGRKETQGAFRALQRGYAHWASGRLDRLEINYRHPEYCHVRCSMTPSMKTGLYRVYLLLGREGTLATIKKATCQCAAGESASCTHVSGLLHALVAMAPPEVDRIPCASTVSDGDSESQEPLPVTSFACQWKLPRKRKESTIKITDVTFQKHVYGRTHKHTLKSMSDFDPRPVEHRGTAPDLLRKFITAVKGKGLGVSSLFDKDMRVWTDDISAISVSDQPLLPSRNELFDRVTAFKESLRLTPEKIREIERETIDQSQSPLWYSARRYRLTASAFGKVFQRLPSTPPDSLVKQLLHPQQFSTSATDWGKQHESEALKMYVEHQTSSGNDGLIAVRAGFVVCEEYHFLGASPDAYVYDPSCIHQFGVAEIKCPYKYRDLSPEEAASNPDFCCVISMQGERKVLRLKQSHQYYSQIQGQLAITQRLWCDFIIYTKKGISVERINFDSDYWKNKLLPKLTAFYDDCLCPAIVSPVHLLGMKMHDLRVSQ